jgi:hypothetical protein
MPTTFNALTPRRTSQVTPRKRRISLRWVFALVLCVMPASTFTSGADTISLADAAEKAVQQSKLTLPGSKPFHLQAEILEPHERDSDFHANIEEFWVSPTKWKRTISSPDFSQTLVVNGDSVSETDTGDYFPFWLNTLVTAMVDPLPMLNTLKQSRSQIPKPRGGANSTICGDLHARVDRWVICFEGDRGLLTSVFTKGYAAEFKDYKKFGDKHVARLIVTDPEPGTTLEARVTTLTDFNQPDDPMFTIKDPTPPAGQIHSVRIDEDTFRKLVDGSTEIDWPPTGGGMATGGCAVYVSADRTGHVREAWPEGCDNVGLQDPLREMVKKWRLNPTINKGVPIQVEALLGFTFHTTVHNSHPLPELSDAEARKLATSIMEPVFPPGTAAPGTQFIVQISVDETGKLAGIQNTHKLNSPALLAIYSALQKWHFTPYLKDGKPQYFHANLAFQMQ